MRTVLRNLAALLALALTVSTAPAADYGLKQGTADLKSAGTCQTASPRCAVLNSLSSRGPAWLAIGFSPCLLESCGTSGKIDKCKM